MKDKGKQKREEKEENEKGQGSCSSQDKIVKKRRFNVPFELKCKECNSTIERGFKVNAIKTLVGKYYTSRRKIWSYSFKCPAGCECEIVMDKTYMDSHKYSVFKGARVWEMGVDGFDWDAWKWERAKEFFDKFSPSLGESLGRANMMKIYESLAANEAHQ